MCTCVVIVNWNAGEQLAACVRGVLQWSGRTVTQVVVVDNASRDNSLDLLCEVADPRVEIVRSSENLGFSKACNLGAKRSKASTILFLNPDTAFFQDTISVSESLLADPGVGACGIRLVDEAGHTHRHSGREATFTRMLFHKVPAALRLGTAKDGLVMEDWDHETSRPVSHVIGAYLHVRTETHRQIGGFDERFFLYYEDLDYSKRLADAGYRIEYIATVSACHKGGGTSDRIRVKRFVYSTVSRMRFIHKHFGPLGLIAGVLMVMLVELPVRGVAAGARLIAPRSPE